MTYGLVAAFLAAFARAAAFFFAAPVVGDRNVPAKVRVAAAAGLALVAAPVRPPVDPAGLAVVLPGEILLGLIAGFTGRVILAGVESGAQLIALNMGLGMANTFDPSLGESADVIRRMTLALASLAFLHTGGLEGCIRVIATAPVVDAALSGAVINLVVGSGHMLEVALRLAAPCMVAGLVAQVGLALASKASPALNIFSVMLAMLLIVGVFTLIASAPALVQEITGVARSVVDHLQGVLLP